jgi:hypothetical protein
VDRSRRQRSGPSPSSGAGEYHEKYQGGGEREGEVNKWFGGKMQQLKDEVARVNGGGWVHGDIEGNAGNVRWDTETGKPFLIDWGSARKRRKDGEQGPGKPETDRINEDTWCVHLNDQVDKWADNQQKGTQQATGSTAVKGGEGCP